MRTGLVGKLDADSAWLQLARASPAITSAMAAPAARRRAILWQRDVAFMARSPWCGSFADRRPAVAGRATGLILVLCPLPDGWHRRWTKANRNSARGHKILL